ncbi:T9SS type A sorting domain-containing protein [Flavisolibacter nicotianae]|uniref:T9SS type A sorting domain-containing protein n=1 Tax=Flavisolibacter nicotianae TaxID=2364882 RepID=UPI0013C4E119|nr:T9SS type A sorting domain-containing protein [Flavisolibacter nicotianae]
MKNCLLFLAAIFFLTESRAQSDTAVVSPVPLTVFQVQAVDKVVLLKWSIQETEDFKSFDIERSEDGINFTKVGSKLAISKGSNADYDFVDATPKQNVSLRYRLKLISKDGISVYSDLKEARVSEMQIVVRLKQNPVRNNIEVELTAASARQASLTVVSQNGLQVATQTFRLSTGINQLSLSAQSLLQGLYQLVVEAGSERKTLSFIKE